MDKTKKPPKPRLAKLKRNHTRVGVVISQDGKGDNKNLLIRFPEGLEDWFTVKELLEADKEPVRAMTARIESALKKTAARRRF